VPSSQGTNISSIAWSSMAPNGPVPGVVGPLEDPAIDSVASYVLRSSIKDEHSECVRLRILSTAKVDMDVARETSDSRCWRI
jgi:hypothetical protein